MKSIQIQIAQLEQFAADQGKTYLSLTDKQKDAKPGRKLIETIVKLIRIIKHLVDADNSVIEANFAFHTISDQCNFISGEFNSSTDNNTKTEGTAYYWQN